MKSTVTFWQGWKYFSLCNIRTHKQKQKETERNIF